MFRPLALYIGLRYTRAKKRNHFVSFISFISMFGIALGVAVLITVLSVMNGFDYEIHNRLFNMSSHVIVTDVSGSMQNWKKLTKTISKTKDVIGMAPFIAGQGMLSYKGTAQGIMVTGILPRQQVKVSNIGEKMVKGKMTALKSNRFGIVIGQALALNIGAKMGDKVILVTPKTNMTPMGLLPRFKEFKVVGIFNVDDDGFGYDTGMAFIHLKDAQKLLQLGKSVSGLRLKVDNLYAAPKVSNDLLQTLPERYAVTNWTQQYSTYFKAITMEKTTMFIVLLFIIAVAVFNLISSLVMTVNNKQADIAILRTLGATPGTIMRIFIIQGALLGLIGTLLGVVGGALLALNAPAVVAWIEHTFHTQFISASIYFINYLPSRLDWWTVLYVGLAAFIMSLLATIYPAWKAARTHPVEALRYE